MLGSDELSQVWCVKAIKQPQWCIGAANSELESASRDLSSNPLRSEIKFEKGGCFILFQKIKEHGKCRCFEKKSYLKLVLQ